MLLRIQRIGSGVDGDSWRVPMPDFSVVVDNDGAGNMIVSVPDRALPTGFASNPGLTMTALSQGQVCTAMNATARAVLDAHHVKNYPVRVYAPVIR